IGRRPSPFLFLPLSSGIPPPPQEQLQPLLLTRGNTVNIEQRHYITASGLRIQRSVQRTPYETAIAALREQLDNARGVLLSSSFEYPGRYTRWDLGFVNP